MANPLDPAGLYKRYQAAQAARGLGSRFQEEGAGIGPSSGLAQVLQKNRELLKGRSKLGDFQKQARMQEDRIRAKDMRPNVFFRCFSSLGLLKFS